MKAEKAFIRKALEYRLPILRVCLGSQLLADCLGAKAYLGHEKEIDWFPISVPRK
ncbi:hypothetical protein EWH99_11600 [Sporolactobacillus sp. THM7-7]|nr:hypothetical protein EWH99_11600 [Sporolactobacillus sp. THM7-7]